MKTRYILVRTILQMLLMVIAFDRASSAAPIDSASHAEANTFFQNQDWKNAAAC
ncbi:MAG: hypothetical protein JNN25_13550 [Candidatus Kapabacteria bacterium]|nr:hypothetical protein [Candidatus Kapabacteria bacterium]